MTEADAIASASKPATVTSLVDELRALGLDDGMTVMVHSSLSRLGFVLGGAQTVVAALHETVGPGGTIMMPTHSGALSDPSKWQNPPVPETWWQTIRDEMPAFDPALTPPAVWAPLLSASDAFPECAAATIQPFRLPQSARIRQRY